MKTFGGLLAALSIAWCVGCGGGSGPAPIGPIGTGGTTSPPATTPAEYVVGNWIAKINSTCAEVIDFSAAGSYSHALLCVLDSGTVGLEDETGTYVVSGSRLIFTPIKATCAESTSEVGGADFTASSSSLTISYLNGISLYVRNDSAGGGNGAVAIYGCFRMGVFTASPLDPIVK